MSKWTKETIDAAKTIKAIRRSGVTEPLAIVTEAELIDSRSWLAKRDYENQLMQLCILSMINGGSPCLFCQEHDEKCPKEIYHPSGCEDWWLRFLTEEEEDACNERAAKGQGDAGEGPLPGRDPVQVGEGAEGSAAGNPETELREPGNPG